MAQYKIEDALGIVARPAKLARHLKIPDRHTLTGVTYFYLIEHRDDDGIVNIEPLRKLLNERKGWILKGDGYTTMRQVHRKMDVLRLKHGMSIEKHGKEPYIYRVKPISESVEHTPALEVKLRDIFRAQAKAVAAYAVTVDQAEEDFMVRIKSEFRWGPK